jgi:hypothetical protein
MKWIIFLLLFSSQKVFAVLPVAGFDSKVEAGGQTYSLGGTMTGTAGYGLELWRDSTKENEPTFWQYGYVRPVAEFKTALVTHRLTGALEIYPISILGISAGGGADLRYYNRFTDFDCGNLQCDQSLMFQFMQARLIVGYDKFVGIVTGRYDQYRAETSSKAFYDEMSYLIGRPGSDDLRSLNLLALYRDNAVWGYGVLAIYQQFIFSQANSSSVFAAGTYRDGPWLGTFGLGTFQSSHQAQKPSAVFLLQYTFGKTIGLIN